MTTELKLPKGFTSCPPVMADLPAAVDLMNLCSLEMIGNQDATIKDIETEWSTPGLDPENDQRLVFAPDGTLAAYIEVWAIHDNPVHPWVWGRVHPEYKGRGLGTAMLAWGEERAQQVLEIVPPEARVSFRCNAPETHPPGNDLLSGYGMELIRHSFQMRIQLTEEPPAPVWPEGITVRTYQPGDIEDIYRTDDEAFSDHFGHVPEEYEAGLERFTHFFLEGEYFDPELWFLAFDGDEMAAVCLCRTRSWEDENLGWVASLAVRRPWRKRGLGLALLHQSFNASWERGKQGVGLGVDAENLTGALNLYKKAGMSVHRQYNLYEKEIRPGKELATT